MLGRTLPSLLDESCDQTANDRAFNQWTDTGWQSLSNTAFRAAAETVALGLLDLGLETGDRVALLMQSDVNFCIADMGCLLAHLVDVPIDLTQTIEHILFVLHHSEARALVIANLDLLIQLVPYLPDAPQLQSIIVAEVPTDWQVRRHHWNLSPPYCAHVKPLAEIPEIPIPASLCLDIPTVLHPAHPASVQTSMPPCLHVLSWADLQQRGQAQASAERLQQLRSALTPDTLATIIYIPDETGQMQGVMLTHENLSANALASFSGISELGRGEQETVLSFLPLNHVLARSMLYGHMNYGHCIYFSNPNRVIKHLKEVQPTVLVTVPLFLEKIYNKILERGSRARQSVIGTSNADTEILGNTYTSPFLVISTAIAARIRFSLMLLQSLQVVFTQFLFRWALSLAQRYELGRSPQGLYQLLLKLADWLMFSKWRTVFGGRLKHLICGGAALSAEITNVFAAAGIRVLHGYGLTQASAVVCCNRGVFNRAGTVGMPIAGAQVAIAADGEILVRGPYVTPGYYKNGAASEALIDPQGWLHTGDLGRFTDEGFLQITGLKKALFKLSTGKYVAPQPIEQRVMQSPLVAQAIVVGSEQKFCAMLIVPDLEALHHHAQIIGFDRSDGSLLNHPCTLALYQSLVDAANCRLPYWGTVKRFQLINAAFTIENGLLTATGQINRAHVLKAFASDIERLYREDTARKGINPPTEMDDLAVVACPVPIATACPAYAQSLNLR